MTKPDEQNSAAQGETEPNQANDNKKTGRTVWEKLPEGPGRLTLSFGNALERMSLEEQSRFLVNMWETLSKGVQEKYGVHAVGGRIESNAKTKNIQLTVDVIKKTPKPGA